MWAVRIMHENQFHSDSCFLTFTYDDEHLPYGGDLHYRHFQLFMKKARAKLDLPLSYFMCGEYGEKFSRPHYHACFFGFGFRSDRVLHATTGCGEKIYSSALLSSLWTLGFASVGELSWESAGYVARYVCKKVTGPKAEDHYCRTVLDTGEVINLTPEFARMSLNPAVGSRWYDKYTSDVFPRDEVIINGGRVRPPRYYSEKYKLSNPVEFDAIKAARLERAMACVDDCTPARLAVREKVKVAQLQSKIRSL